MIQQNVSPDELLSRAVAALLDSPVAEDGYAEGLVRTREALAQAEPVGPAGSAAARRIWRTLMTHKKLTLSAAAVVIICIGVGLFLTVPLTRPSVAFSDVLEEVSKVQSMRARITMKGKTGELWAKRPDKLRIDWADGTYEISNGPTSWVVDPDANRAVTGPSLYYLDARRRGADVLDMLAGLQYTDNFSGFFSQRPVDSVERGGRTLDVYRMQVAIKPDMLMFEAFVDRKTRLPASISLEVVRDGQRKTHFSLSVHTYDAPISDEKFEFKPAKGMTVVQRKASLKAQVPPPPGGSTLSGRIVWSDTGKPVGGARLTFSGSRARRKADGTPAKKFFTRAETDQDGRWTLRGVPADTIAIDVRSWELAWPAVPSFKCNIGSAMRPKVRVDGISAYPGLDFRVHRPEDYYAKITIKVIDEDGRPVAGVGARLFDEGWNYQQPIHADAVSRTWVTGDQGKFQADDIWPTDRSVRVTLFHPDLPGTYATWAAMSEPFVVKSAQSYEFEMVVPFARRVRLTVKDPSGKPVPGLIVKMLAGPGGWVRQILPLIEGKDRQEQVTDDNGVVEIHQLAPGMEASVTLVRMANDGKRRAPLASACVSVTGPQHREIGELTATFDERPIRIEGTIDSLTIPDKATLGYVYCAAGKDRHTWRSDSRRKDGSFVLEALPAGKVRLGVCFIEPDHPERLAYKNLDPPIRLEPGNTYIVKITGGRVEVLSVMDCEADGS